MKKVKKRHLFFCPHDEDIRDGKVAGHKDALYIARLDLLLIDIHCANCCKLHEQVWANIGAETVAFKPEDVDRVAEQ